MPMGYRVFRGCQGARSLLRSPVLAHEHRESDFAPKSETRQLLVGPCARWGAAGWICRVGTDVTAARGHVPPAFLYSDAGARVGSFESDRPEPAGGRTSSLSASKATPAYRDRMGCIACCGRHRWIYHVLPCKLTPTARAVSLPWRGRRMDGGAAISLNSEPLQREVGPIIFWATLPPQAPPVSFRPHREPRRCHETYE